MAINRLANDTLFFVSFMGTGLCFKKTDEAKLELVEGSGDPETDTVEYALNKFRRRMTEFIDDMDLELNKIAVVNPMINLIKKIAEKNGNAENVEMVGDTLKKAQEAADLAKARMALANEMLVEVVEFMLEFNVPVQQLDGAEVSAVDPNQKLADLISKFKGLGGFGGLTNGQ